MRQLTNASRAVTLARSYDPYGNVLTSVGTGTTSFNFAGEWRDNTGLLHLRARYYGSQWGRFLTADSWGGDYRRPLTLNQWNYSLSNPVNYTDPSGRTPWPQANIKALQALKPYILASAQRHNNFAESDLTNEAFAALMAVYLNRESRLAPWTHWRSFGWDQLGDVAGGLGADTSTGIANIRPSVALEILRGIIPGIPGEFSYEICGSEYKAFLLDASKYMWILKPSDEEARRYGIPEKYIGKSPPPSEADQRLFVYKELQNDALSIEYLAANIERGVDRANYYGIKPSIFNLGTWIWRGVQRRSEIIEMWEKHGKDATLNSVAYIGDMPKAFQVLGLPMTYYNAYNLDEADFVDRSFFKIETGAPQPMWP